MVFPCKFLRKLPFLDLLSRSHADRRSRAGKTICKPVERHTFSNTRFTWQAFDPGSKIFRDSPPVKRQALPFEKPGQVFRESADLFGRLRSNN